MREDEAQKTVLIFWLVLVKIPCGRGLGGHWGLELGPRGSKRRFRGGVRSENLHKEANKVGHNGPRRPPEGQSGESWDHFEEKS